MGFECCVLYQIKADHPEAQLTIEVILYSSGGYSNFKAHTKKTHTSVQRYSKVKSSSCLPTEYINTAYQVLLLNIILL